jgi:hypothetical protein
MIFILSLGIMARVSDDPCQDNVDGRFLHEVVIRKRGFGDLCVLLFMHLDTREMFVTSATAHSHSA